MLVLLTDYEKRQLDKDHDGVWNDVIRRMKAVKELALGTCPILLGQQFSAKGSPVWVLDTAILEVHPKEVPLELGKPLTVVEVAFFHHTDEKKQWMVKFDKVMELIPWDQEFFKKVP